ncbi:MAG: DUF2950 family protein [Candidatus Korobacteraceae bacterium]
MRTKTVKFGTVWKKLAWVLASVVALLVLLAYAGLSFAQGSEAKTFSSPAEASNALFNAVQRNDEQALESILGAGKELCSSGDEVEDRLERERFSQKYEEMHRLVREADGSTVLYVGAENWPFPVPLLSSHRAWYFDPKAGKQEILFREVGENEITAIRVSDAFVMAKKQDKTTATGDDPISLYAEELLADANTTSPFHGYYFRPVRGNSATATGGKNTAALALVAYPAQYGSSGVTTFIVTQDGVVREKDLGPKTETLAPRMEKLNHLASTWQVATTR